MNSQEQLAIRERFETAPTETDKQGSSLSGYRPVTKFELVFAAIAFFPPLSIAAARIFAVLAIFIWFAKARRPEDSLSRRSAEHRTMSLFLVLWFLCCLVSSLAGVEPWRALMATFRNIPFLLLPLSVFWFVTSPKQPAEICRRAELLLAALVVGQSVAALHTMLSALFDQELRPRPPGAVTESGLLLLSIPCLVALVARRAYRENSTAEQAYRGQAYRGRTFFAVFCAALTILLFASWHKELLSSDGVITQLFAGVCLAAFLFVCFKVFSSAALERRELTSGARGPLLSALLAAALIVNLKRGPWLGVFVEFLLLGWGLARRSLVLIALGTVLLLALLAPVRHRAAAFLDDFTISGGRQAMWELGVELVQRFPLGLGTDNASYMRQLDPSLPAMHQHMHNNLLNVAVETGWLGLAIYIAWMWHYCSLGFKLRGKIKSLEHHAGADRFSTRLTAIAVCLSAALVGWQAAGIVEYNFGDGEIRTVAMVFIGLLTAIQFSLNNSGPDAAD
jgi:hypothetical protein